LTAVANVTVPTKQKQSRSYFPKPVMLNLRKLCFTVMPVLVRCFSIQTFQFNGSAVQQTKASYYPEHDNTVNIVLNATQIY